MQNKIKENIPCSAAFISLLLTLLGFATASFNILSRFHFSNSKKDVFMYIECAHNILNANGFTTSILFPAHVLEHGFTQAPMPANRILHPLFISLFRLIADNWLAAAALASGLFFVLSIPVIYFLARKVFSPRTALLSALAWTLAVPDGVSEYIICGYSEHAFIFPFFAGVLAAFHAKDSRHFAAAGMLVGMAGLARPALPLCLPPALMLAYLVSEPGKRIKHTTVFLVFSLIPLLSVKWINIFVFGNGALYENPATEGLKPLICYTRLFKHMAPVYHTDLENLGSLFFREPMFIVMFALKFAQTLKTVTVNFANLISGNLVWLSVLSGLGLFVPAADNNAKRMKYFYIAMLVTHTIGIAASFYFPRYFFPVLPLTIIMAASFADFVIGKTRKRIQPALLGLCFIVLFTDRNPFPKPMTWENRLKDAREVIASEECYSYLDSFIPEDAPVATDLHAKVFAWKTGFKHPLMLLPRTFGMFEQIHDKTRLDTIVLVPGFVNGEYGYTHEWHNLFKHPDKSFLGFEPHVFKHGSSHSVVFTRNSQRLSQELTAQAKDADTAERLELLGRALLIDPENKNAKKLLEQTVQTARLRGEKLIAAAQDEFRKNNIEDAWKLFQNAGTFIPGLQKPELMSRVETKKLCGFNPLKDRRIKMTISHFPTPKYLSDRRSSTTFYGFDTDIYFDLSKSRQAQEIKIWVNNDTDEFAIPETIEIYSGTDNFNWTRIEGKAFTAKRHNGRVLGIKELNCFGRFFKVSIRSKPHRPVALSEIILSGYVPAGN